MTIIERYCPVCSNWMKKNGTYRGVQRYRCNNTNCQKGQNPVHQKFEKNDLQLYCHCGKQATKDGASRGKQRYCCTKCKKAVSTSPYEHLTETERKEILIFWINNNKKYNATMQKYNMSRYKLKKIIEESTVELIEIKNYIESENEKRYDEIYNYWMDYPEEKAVKPDEIAEKFGISRNELRRILSKKQKVKENWYILYKLRVGKPLKSYQIKKKSQVL